MVKAEELSRAENINVRKSEKFLALSFTALSNQDFAVQCHKINCWGDKIGFVRGD